MKSCLIKHVGVQLNAPTKAKGLKGYTLPAPIEGKIAKILDEFNVVINVGRLHGVTEGMPFVIYSPGEEEIKDPDTGKSVGYLEIVKGYVRASHVQENLTLCVAETVEKEERRGMEPQTLSGAMIAASMGPKAGAEARLNVNPLQVSGMAKGGNISIGDRVRSLEQPDFSKIGRRA
ncbi:MAG TPA: hypothetical protein ACFYEM_10670 [Candidatus Hypogeohydataceae bacterium YC40]